MKNTIKFSADQEKALRSMLSGHNVFLTGEAGTGKSTVVEEFKRRCGCMNIVVVAPTGVAALNVHGSTIHSFFRLGTGIPTKESLSEGKYSVKMRKVYESMDVLIIDEVSMVRSDIFFAMDFRLRQTRSSSRPFGGVQVIVVGDFFQLPPVVKDDFVEGTDMRVSDFLISRYGGIYAFQTEAWKEANFANEKLTIIHRQGGDKVFTDILNNIRHGHCDDKQLELIKVGEDKDATVLAPTKAIVERINATSLKRLKGETITYTAEVSGAFKESEAGKKAKDKDDPVDREIKMKVGTRVILLANNGEKGHVNGDTGVVEEANALIVKVKLDRGITVDVEPYIWEKVKYVYNEKRNIIEDQVIGTFKQMPLRPAYAITIHKSQGMTLSRVNINLTTECFAPGQLYVALSRCKSLDGLSSSRTIREEDIICDPCIEEFYNSLAPGSDALEATIADTDTTPETTITVKPDVAEVETTPEEETVTMQIPKCISDVITNLIEKYKIFGEQSIRQKYDYVATDATVAKRVKKADIESEVNSYSDETQDKLSSFTTAEKEFYCMLQKADKGLKAKDIAEEKKVSEEWARRTLAKLVKAGLVERRGSKKTGAYHPTKNEDEFSFTARCQKCPVFARSGIS